MPYDDSEIFYRRVPNNEQSLTPDENLGGVRSNSGSWEEREGDLVSVFAHSALEAAGLKPDAVLRERPDFHIASVTGSELRALGLDIEPDPTDEGPEGVAHAVVTGIPHGNRSQKVRSKIAKVARFIPGHEPPQGLLRDGP